MKDKSDIQPGDLADIQLIGRVEIIERVAARLVKVRKQDGTTVLVRPEICRRIISLNDKRKNQ